MINSTFIFDNVGWVDSFMRFFLSQGFLNKQIVDSVNFLIDIIARNVIFISKLQRWLVLNPPGEIDSVEFSPVQSIHADFRCVALNCIWVWWKFKVNVIDIWDPLFVFFFENAFQISWQLLFNHILCFMLFWST